MNEQLMNGRVGVMGRREGVGDYSLASDIWISHPNEPSTTNTALLGNEKITNSE
jgi:hypothetical protein